MKRQAVSKTIDGVEYQFGHISVKLKNNNLLKILKVLGKPLAGAVTGAATDTESVMDESNNIGDFISIGGVVQGLTESLDEKTVNDIIDFLFSQTICVGKGVVSTNFDEVFSDSLLHMWKVVFAALEVYYGSFFAEGLELIKKAVATYLPALTQGK